MRHLRNHAEESVTFFLDMHYKDADICQCDDCRLDVMAIMLNQLPPKYVVTEKGDLFAQMDELVDPQTQINFMKMMAEAVKIVKASPRHDDQDA